MREILFRAKRIDNWEWVEGLLQKMGVYYIIHSKDGEEAYFINPETLCQYTGLTDKNGRKIWENDICIIHSSNIDEEDGYFTVEWDNEGARYVLNGEGMTVDFDNIYWYEIEVIGNIFDNSELLKED